MLKSFLTRRQHPEHLVDILEQHYLAYSRIQPPTIARYRCELRRWDRLVGRVPIRKITTAHFTAFRNACVDAGLSASSIEGSVKIVRILLRFARDRGWLTALPLTGKPLAIVIDEPEPATLDELSRLYAATPHALFPGRKCVCPRDWMRAFLVVEYWTGIRAENLLWRLEWKHIREDAIRFRQTKTNKQHVFPHHPIVTEHLKLVHGMDANRVFAIKTLQRVNNEIGRLCEIAGIRRLTTGHIREACFTQWTLAGEYGEVAGKIIHGCGIPKILRRHYLGRLQILEKAAPYVDWPEEIVKPSGEIPLKCFAAG